MLTQPIKENVVKQKGVTLDSYNQDRINFDECVHVVKGENACMASAERFTFQWDGKTKHVVTTDIQRTITSTAHEKTTLTLATHAIHYRMVTD